MAVEKTAMKVAPDPMSLSEVVCQDQVVGGVSDLSEK
jgi:hypothetical protein